MGGPGEGLAEAVDVLVEAPLVDAGEGVPAHGGSGLGGSEDAAECIGESGDVSGGVDEAFDPVGDEVDGGAYVVRDDDGARSVHDFVDDEPPGLVTRREDEDRGEIEESGELGLVAEAAEADAFEAGGGCLGLEVGTLFAVANDDEVGVGIDAWRWGEVGVSFDELGGVLALLELGGKENDWAGWIEGELGLEGGSGGVSGCGTVLKVAVIDCVRHEGRGHRLAQVPLPVVPVEGANREDAVDQVAESGKKSFLDGEFGAGAPAVAKPGLGAEENRDA